MTLGLGAMKGYAKDAGEVAALGLGVLGGQVAWGFASGYLPSAVTQYAWATPALELAAGVLALTMLKSNKKYVKEAALGAAAGLGAGGVLGLLNVFNVLPGHVAVAQAAGAAGGSGAVAGYLSGAPVSVEEVSGFAGAPVTVEEVSGFGNLAATIY